MARGAWRSRAAALALPGGALARPSGPAPRRIGVWLTNSPSPLYYDPRRIEKAVAELAESGFTTIYPNVWSRGTTFHRSRHAPMEPALVKPLLPADYQTALGTLSFADGETRQNFSIPITADADTEGEEAEGADGEDDQADDGELARQRAVDPRHLGDGPLVLVAETDDVGADRPHHGRQGAEDAEDAGADHDDGPARGVDRLAVSLQALLLDAHGPVPRTQSVGQGGRADDGEEGQQRERHEQADLGDDLGREDLVVADGPEPQPFGPQVGEDAE